MNGPKIETVPANVPTSVDNDNQMHQPSSRFHQSLNTFKGFVYSSSQALAINFVNLKWTKPLKVFKTVKGLSACVFNELIVLEFRSQTN